MRRGCAYLDVAVVGEQYVGCFDVAVYFAWQECCVLGLRVLVGVLPCEWRYFRPLSTSLRATAMKRWY